MNILFEIETSFSVTNEPVIVPYEIGIRHSKHVAHRQTLLGCSMDTFVKGNVAPENYKNNSKTIPLNVICDGI